MLNKFILSKCVQAQEFKLDCERCQEIWSYRERVPSWKRQRAHEKFNEIEIHFTWSMIDQIVIGWYYMLNKSKFKLSNKVSSGIQYSY